MSYVEAEAPGYRVRIAVDENEIDLPFMIRAGKDYATGDDLNTVAKRIADEVVEAKWSGVNEVVGVRIFPAEPVTGCTDDDDPAPLVSAESYKW